MNDVSIGVLTGKIAEPLSSDAWQRTGAMREFMSAPQVHKALEPTEFPTPPKRSEANARWFVCDALQGKGKAISFPARSLTHTSLSSDSAIASKLSSPSLSSYPPLEV